MHWHLIHWDIHLVHGYFTPFDLCGNLHHMVQAYALLDRLWRRNLCAQILYSWRVPHRSNGEAGASALRVNV